MNPEQFRGFNVAWSVKVGIYHNGGKDYVAKTTKLKLLEKSLQSKKTIEEKECEYCTVYKCAVE